MTKLYFKNEQTGRRYEVVKFDLAENTVTLKGEHAEFVEPYDKEKFVQLGYVLEREAA